MSEREVALPGVRNWWSSSVIPYMIEIVIIIGINERFLWFPFIVDINRNKDRKKKMKKWYNVDFMLGVLSRAGGNVRDER